MNAGSEEKIVGHPVVEILLVLRHHVFTCAIGTYLEGVTGW